MSESTKQLSLGSLFDGIGAFPYASSFFGIKTLWASEIMPEAVSVTKRHFPNMQHFGDITKLDGAKLPPTDIVTFGSPCQDLSVAGRRLGMKQICSECKAEYEINSDLENCPNCDAKIEKTRSGLFMDALRIIDEMRDATNGKYPRFAIWENVPGALSSGKPYGADFKAVLEAFTKTEVPIPKSGKWSNAGMVRSDRVDIAWIIYNAQHFGVPQRRRRLFLVADFGGRCAGEILFVPKSLSGYFAACRQKGQRITVNAQTSSGGTSGCSSIKSNNCVTPWDIQQSRIFAEQGTSPTLAGADGGGGRNAGGLVLASFIGEAGSKARSIGYSETTSPTLKSGASGFSAPCLCEPRSVKTNENNNSCIVVNDQGGSCLNVEKSELSPTLRGEAHGNLPFVSICKSCLLNSRTRSENDSHIFCVNPARCSVSCNVNNLSPTLTSYHEQHIVCRALGFNQRQDGNVTTFNVSCSLTTNGNATGRNAPLVCENICAYSISSEKSNSMMSANPHSGCHKVETARTLDTTNPCPSKNQGGIAVVEVHPKVSGTLCASGVGLSRPAGITNETDLCVVVPECELIHTQDEPTAAYCLQGSMVGRKDENGPNGLGVNAEVSYTLNTTDNHAVAYKSSSFADYQEGIGTIKASGGDLGGGSETLLCSKCSAHHADDCKSGVDTVCKNNCETLEARNYVVRRLTPTECERLQGFCDDWTKYKDDGAVICDTKRYQMLGNSIATPCIAYIMAGIIQAFEQNKEGGSNRTERTYC